MSTLAVNTIQAETGSTVTVASGHALDASNGISLPAGHVIQVKQTTLESSTDFNSSGYATLMSVTITPKSSSSKFLVIRRYRPPRPGRWIRSLRRRGHPLPHCRSGRSESGHISHLAARYGASCRPPAPPVSIAQPATRPSLRSLLPRLRLYRSHGLRAQRRTDGAPSKPPHLHRENPPRTRQPLAPTRPQTGACRANRPRSLYA